MKTRDDLNQQWKFPLKVFKVFLVFILVLFIQFSYLSLSPVVYGINMDKFAANRNTVKTTLTANRGTIYDKDGKILALNVSSYTVIAYLESDRTTNPEDPQHVVDPKLTAQKLAPILNMEASYLEDLLTQDLYQVELGPGGRGITELKKDEIEALELPGIDFIESKKRNYPNGNFASYVLGYAKRYDVEYKDNNGNTKIKEEIVGELGIEAKYDDLLKGTDGYLIYQQDRLGYKIPDTKETRVDAKDGASIYLTLDTSIQRFIETAVKETEELYDPEWFTLTVMDAKTGKILGTGSSPSFDPNIRDIENYENPLTSYLFEPGSIMKTFTYMCAIEKGTYKGDETFLSGHIDIGPDRVNDWNPRGWGVITYDKGLEYSSNVGIANMVTKFIDKAELHECFKKYGFGDVTGVELPREMKGTLNFNYPIEVAAAGYGQGIFITPVQMLQALTIIANDGRMLKPHIVEKIVDSNGDILYESKVEESEPIVKQETVNQIKDLLYEVVHGKDAATTGTDYNIPGFDVIGKTGTAQIYDNENGRYFYGSNAYVFSFTGMFPKDNPEIIVYGSLKRPKSQRTKGLSDAVNSVTKSVAKYLNMFGEETNPNTGESVQIASYTSQELNKVLDEINKKGLDIIIIGDGNYVTNQYPKAGTSMLKDDKLFLITNGTKYIMPDLKGWSRKDIMQLCDLYNIECEFEGYGYVKSQSISKGTVIKGKEKLKVVLKDKYKFEENKDDKKG